MQFQRALLAAAALALATQAQAAESLFGNRAGFEATLAKSVTDTYSNPGYVFILSFGLVGAAARRRAPPPHGCGRLRPNSHKRQLPVSPSAA